MGKYRSIIWDMDGTLLDTLSDIVESVNATMRAFSLPEHTRNTVRDSVGNGITRLVELTVPGGKAPAVRGDRSVLRRPLRQEQPQPDSPL